MPLKKMTQDEVVTNDLKLIDEWVEETVADRAGSPYAVTADECFSDIVHAYLDTEVGTSQSSRRREILRRTGVGERG